MLDVLNCGSSYMEFLISNEKNYEHKNNLYELMFIFLANPPNSICSMIFFISSYFDKYIGLLTRG